jgi:hypothetical protein
MTEDQARAKLKDFLDKATHNHLQRTLDRISDTDDSKKLRRYIRSSGTSNLISSDNGEGK